MATASGHTSAIRSSKVIGTTVKDLGGTTIGKVEDILLDKQSNNIMFVIISFGGFLGIGEKYHPIPWSGLSYEPVEDAYLISYTKEQLEKAPADSIEELSKDDGRYYRDRSFDYYGAARYWQ